LVPRISSGPARARDVQRKADLQQIATAMELYYADNGEYPNSAGTVPEDFCVGAELDSYLGNYMDLPDDPGSGSPMGCTNDYYYHVMAYSSGGSTPSAYALIAEMEISSVSADSSGYFCLATEKVIPYTFVDLQDVYQTFLSNNPCGTDPVAYYTVYH